jgi:hypothetical protein
MNLNFKLNVTVNGEPVTVPDGNLHTCSCGSTMGTADDLSQCIECGAWMCLGPVCDCSCPVYADGDQDTA